MNEEDYSLPNHYSNPYSEKGRRIKGTLIGRWLHEGKAKFLYAFGLYVVGYMMIISMLYKTSQNIELMENNGMVFYKAMVELVFVGGTFFVASLLAEKYKMVQALIVPLTLICTLVYFSPFRG